MCALYSFPLRRIRRLPQLNSDKLDYKKIQMLGNLKTPGSSEGLITATFPENGFVLSVRVKKYGQWRTNVVKSASQGALLYLLDVPEAYQDCECEVICYNP